MALATDRKGNVLLEFHSGDQLDLSDAEREIPLPLALVAALHNNKPLFIFNRWRNVWELPGGMIEPGETPEAAARRELAEETGQQTAELRYVGWMKFRLQPDEQLELGVLYVCQLETLQPFEINEEVSSMMLWDMNCAVEGEVSVIDQYLAQLARSSING